MNTVITATLATSRAWNKSAGDAIAGKKHVFQYIAKSSKLPVLMAFSFSRNDCASTCSGADVCTLSVYV